MHAAKTSTVALTDKPAKTPSTRKTILMPITLADWGAWHYWENKAHNSQEARNIAIVGSLNVALRGSDPLLFMSHKEKAMGNCVNCGKQFDHSKLAETWSTLGQMYFCSWECDREWARKKSTVLPIPSALPPQKPIQDAGQKSGQLGFGDLDKGEHL